MPFFDPLLTIHDFMPSRFRNTSRGEVVLVLGLAVCFLLDCGLLFDTPAGPLCAAYCTCCAW